MNGEELLLSPLDREMKSPSFDLSTSCCICKKHGGKLHGGDQGRLKVLEAAKFLGDKTITSLNPDELSTVRYHSKDCYGPYILKGKRKRESQATVVENIPGEEILAGPSTTRSSKRRKTTSSSLRKKRKTLRRVRFTNTVQKQA